MNLIICYDVCETKRRNKLAVLLEGYGLRANYSVFELDVSEREYVLIKDRIARIIEPKPTKSYSTASAKPVWLKARA